MGKDFVISAEYDLSKLKPGKYQIEVRCLPAHSNNFDHEVHIQADNFISESYKINTYGRSEGWKENVLRNYVSVSYNTSFKASGQHKLKISVNHTGIVLDQIAIKHEHCKEYFEIPLD